MRRLSILLISPPLTEPAVPNLAIELLASAARARGHDARTIHGALWQPVGFRDDHIHGIGAQACFTPLYFGLDPVSFVDELVEALRVDFSWRDRVADRRWEDIAESFLFAMGDAERCVRRFTEAINPADYDLIGFSIQFDAQKMAGATIAKALRVRSDRPLFVAGGTGTDGPMGPALLEQFAEYDAVLQGEADESWEQLLDRVATGAPVDDVPGAVFWRGEVLVSVPELAPGRAFLHRPPPDYGPFLAERARSPYQDRVLCLLLETSRGCWWGRKHHCTFCGIRNVDDEYRVRPAADAVALVTDLYDRYRPELLYCTDPIAPLSYLDEVLPELARRRKEGRDWTIFYELKSNLRRRHVARLAAAGVQRVQPGIESFVTSSLGLMDKGSAALQQIAFLKWAQAYGVKTQYGIITGMPGETVADLRSMVPLMDRIWHLQAPADVNRLALHRFSPHFNAPASFGIQDVQPFATQRVIYRAPDERLLRLCYQLDFRVPGQRGEQYAQARAEVVAAMQRWQEAYVSGTTLWSDRQGDQRIIGRLTPGADLDVDVLSDPAEVTLLDACAEVTSLGRIAHRAGLPVERLRSAAGRLADAGLLLLDGGAALSLPLPAEASAEVDADFDEIPQRTAEVVLS
jgi:ribosomal peptide maturation radical SAM protein 1